MNNMEQLVNIHADYMLTRRSLEHYVEWARDFLGKNGFDQDVALLAMPDSDQEILDLARRILNKHDLLSSVEKSLENLIQALEVNFNDNSPPIRVTNYTNNDSDDFDGEGQSVEDFFAGKKWKTINLKGCGGYYLSYFNPEAFAYYIPAFLKFAILESNPGTDINQSLMRVFSDRSELWINEVNKALNSLNKIQKDTILSCLRHISWRDGEFYEESYRIKKIFSR